MITDYYVEAISSRETYPWLLKKHYAHRVPSISYAFGLFNKDKLLQGVMTFGTPPCRFYNKGIGIFNEYSVDVLELNRLVINDKLEKNIASFFISKCFRLLSKPLCLVSFADSNQHHHGYIYIKLLIGYILGKEVQIGHFTIIH